MSAVKLRELGYTGQYELQEACKALKSLFSTYRDPEKVWSILKDVHTNPQLYTTGELGPVSRVVLSEREDSLKESKCKGIWICDSEVSPIIDPKAIHQMYEAIKVPSTLAAALMPDAHLGYGVPIGSILATEGAVIPNAVGVDIACRMKMSVFDAPASVLQSDREHLIESLMTNTRFGMRYEPFDVKREHKVMDDPDWDATPVLRGLKDKAAAQLGTSGGGNHFVEFGMIHPMGGDNGYLALMSHSGSRGFGATVAAHYHKMAVQGLNPRWSSLKDLAWLDIDSEIGQEYWVAMNLCGKYAAACHDVIHSTIAKGLGLDVHDTIENHHNFAWKETHDGVDVIVHRKGATPAGLGVRGIIPGSMADPAYVVVGKGESKSLNSASHGAGRLMSRTQAKQTIDPDVFREYLNDRQVTLLSAGIDESPMAYKDINRVMDIQTDLVSKTHVFYPKIVRMAGDGFTED